MPVWANMINRPTVLYQENQNMTTYTLQRSGSDNGSNLNYLHVCIGKREPLLKLIIDIAITIATVWFAVVTSYKHGRQLLGQRNTIDRRRIVVWKILVRYVLDTEAPCFLSSCSFNQHALSGSLCTNFPPNIFYKFP